MVVYYMLLEVNIDGHLLTTHIINNYHVLLDYLGKNTRCASNPLQIALLHRFPTVLLGTMFGLVEEFLYLRIESIVTFMGSEIPRTL